MNARVGCFTISFRPVECLARWRCLALRRLGRPRRKRRTRFDAATVSGLPARNIGSATMSGRIAGAGCDGRRRPHHGLCGRGERRSLEVGERRHDLQARSSTAKTCSRLGAVAIDPSNSKIVWVGSGRSLDSHSVSVGDGVFKSTMAARTGPTSAEGQRAHRQDPPGNPSDSNDVLACATGHLWKDNDEPRESFGTTDGGKTWTKALAGANGWSGCAMIAASQQDPKTIYAGCGISAAGVDVRSGGPGHGPV